MEKRFEIKTDEMECWIEDTEKNSDYNWYDMEKLCDLLNEQDEKIEKLQEAVKMLKGIKRYDIGELLAENIKLKQSQNIKTIEVLIDTLVNLCSKYFTIFNNNNEQIRVLEVGQISDFINNQITELRGENERYKI